MDLTLSWMLILFLDGVSALFKYGEMLNAVSRLLQKLINIIHASCFFKLECESTCCGFTDIINRKTEEGNFVCEVVNGCGR